LNFIFYLDDRQGSVANCGIKTVISGLRWSSFDRCGLLITGGGYCTRPKIHHCDCNYVENDAE